MLFLISHLLRKYTIYVIEWETHDGQILVTACNSFSSLFLFYNTCSLPLVIIKPRKLWNQS